MPDAPDLELAQFALDRAAIGILHVALDGQVLYANDFVERKLGWKRAELRQMKIFDINPTLTAQSWGEHSRRFIKTGPTIFETLHRRKSGVTFPVEVTVEYVEFKGEAFFVACSRDLSEQKLVEAEREKLRTELAQAQKLESLGRLAGGVAHDFNNLLSVIILGSEELLVDAPVNQRSTLLEVRDAATRSGELTRQLLAFARKQTIAPRPLDLGASIEGMSKMLRRLIGEAKELRLECQPGAWPVAMDPAQLDQLLANLVLNAGDACGERGTIVIELRDVPHDDELLSRHGLGARDSVLLAVHDTGVGMEPEVLQHLFEPFFTTKQPGRGTGLGLATVFGIVSQHGAAIRVESVPGRGSSFLLFFPRSTVPATGSTLAPTHEERGGSETLLVVEDDPTVLRLMQGVLEQLGYRVLTATNAQEARAHAREPSLALVLTDVVMPGTSGVELVGGLRQQRPELRVLFISGYAADAAIRFDARTDYLQKPTSRLALAQKVRAMLDR